MQVTKKALIMLGGLLVVSGFMQTALADNTAKLEMHISDPAHNNTYFVCLGDLGCYSVLASENAHKSFSVMSGDVNALFTANAFTRRMYPQALPASCKVQLAPNQTLKVYGKLAVTPSTVNITGLHCRVG